MNKNLAIVALALLLAGSVSWNALQPPPEPWKPLLEETGFRHLYDVAAVQGAALEQAAAGVGDRDWDLVTTAVEKATAATEHLQGYYLPLTEVRQLVYDADRLLFLGDIAAARAKIGQAEVVLAGLQGLSQAGVGRTLEELYLELERAGLQVDQAANEAPALLMALGHRVNLLLLKGQLELPE